MIKFAIRVLGNLLTLIGLSIAIFTYAPILYAEILYRVMGPYRTIPETAQVTNVEVDETETLVPEEPDSENILPIEAVDNNFSIIIPKIGVNAPIVKDVTTSNEISYMNALRDGVAHAKGTSLPGEEGNIFLFAHSSLNFWQLGPYATVFNLLNKLEDDDTVTLVYDGKRYVYRVYETDVVPGWDTTPFKQEYDESVVTLITCDPPGTTINRRVIKARLIYQES